MKRTSKLMAGVTASILFTGTPPGSAAATPALPQKAERQDEPWKTDPEVLKAADAVYSWMRGTRQDKAKTAEEVSRQFPKLSPPIVEQSLKNLVYRGHLERLGTGSADIPYRYFDRHGLAG